MVLPNVTLGSTGGVAVATGALTDLEVTILGTLVGPGMLLMNADSGFTVGLGGTMVSQQALSGYASLYLAGGTSQVNIDGTLLATETIAILAGIGNNTVTVTGSVTGGSGGVWLGLGAGANDVLVNSGTIRCGTYQDAFNPSQYNNAVFAQGLNARITNLAGGEIVATASEGAGVRLGLGSNGSVISNAGIISASVWHGVDFTLLGAAETGTLFNSGVIRGLAGAFNGNDSRDTVTNRGTMIGTVVLGDGDDVLDGRDGRIDGTVFAGIGNDRMDFRGTGLLAGVVYGGTGLDTILGTESEDTIHGEDDGDDLHGGGGNDALYAGNGGDLVRGGAGDDLIEGGSGLSNLYGGLGDDMMLILYDSGDPLTSLLGRGGAGDDQIQGGFFVDEIYGGDGNDSLYAYDGGDILSGGAGDDLIDLQAGDDVALGGQGDDVLFGGVGADALAGNGGADELNGDSENDTLTGGDGNDRVFGGTNNDRLLGNNGDDHLDGDANRDVLLGGGGDDTVLGGGGFDILTGGQGGDIFVFAFAAEIGTTAGNRDIITDFRVGVDVIDLTEIDANIALGGNQAFAFLGNAAFTNVAGQLRYSAVNGLLQGDANGDGLADFALDLTSRPALTVFDILL